MVLRAQGPAARGRWRDPGRSHLAGSEPVAVSPLIWLITIIAIVALLAFDYFAHVRKAHIPTLRERSEERRVGKEAGAGWRRAGRESGQAGCQTQRTVQGGL